MYVDLRSAEDGQLFEADICIIGAGPAGITIARAMAHARFDVCLVESGGFEPDAEVQSLAGGIMPTHPHHLLEIGRNRQFGGSTNSWSGACAPMSACDFAPRPFIDLDGWPYARPALDPYYRQAQRLFEIGPFDYEPSTWADDGFRPLDLDPEKLETRLWQLSPRTNFGRNHREELGRSAHITVLLHATATEIRANDAATLVEGVEIRSLNGRQALVRSRITILACGAIDNARLLLLSRQRCPQGLGNHQDQVGRYFMQHPHIAAASLRFRGSKAWLRDYKDVRHGDLWLRARIGLSEAVMARERVMNPVASLVNRFITDSLTHTQSIGYVTLKRVLLDVQHGRMPANISHGIVTILKDVRGIAIGFLRHLRDQNGAVYVMGEQYPNPESRVTLSMDRDRLGQEKARVDWRLLPIDKHSIRVLIDVIRQDFARLGIAEIVPDEWLTIDDETWPQSLAGGHHHMGTTRMGDDPASSVVDAEARVHGIANLYAAGSSIFPTVGSANPTLTLVATSLKLADHLAAVMAGDRSAAVA
ncbi:MAG: GMC family oxidoreductase [Rhizobiales bacterium]|nr:GMC family oxidoreductase [Hyphomicrobiales bacterium]